VLSRSNNIELKNGCHKDSSLFRTYKPTGNPIVSLLIVGISIVIILFVLATLSNKTNYMEVDYMNQDKIFEITKKATEAPLEFTRSVIEQSKKLRHPSPKVAKIGSVVGSSVGAGLLFTGVIQLLIGKPLWAIGSFSAGAITVASHIINYKKRSSK